MIQDDPSWRNCDSRGAVRPRTVLITSALQAPPAKESWSGQQQPQIGRPKTCLEPVKRCRIQVFLFNIDFLSFYGETTTQQIVHNVHIYDRLLDVCGLKNSSVTIHRGTSPWRRDGHATGALAVNGGHCGGGNRWPGRAAWLQSHGWKWQKSARRMAWKTKQCWSKMFIKLLGISSFCASFNMFFGHISFFEPSLDCQVLEHLRGSESHPETAGLSAFALRCTFAGWLLKDWVLFVEQIPDSTKSSWDDSHLAIHRAFSSFISVKPFETVDFFEKKSSGLPWKPCQQRAAPCALVSNKKPLISRFLLANRPIVDEKK